MGRLRRACCWLIGHAYDEKTFVSRGRRIEASLCRRCGSAGSVVVKPYNRAVRRRWARVIAKEVAR